MNAKKLYKIRKILVNTRKASLYGLFLFTFGLMFYVQSIATNGKPIDFKFYTQGSIFLSLFLVISVLSHLGIKVIEHRMMKSGDFHIAYDKPRLRAISHKIFLLSIFIYVFTVTSVLIEGIVSRVKFNITAHPMSQIMHDPYLNTVVFCSVLIMLISGSILQTIKKQKIFSPEVMN